MSPYQNPHFRKWEKEALEDIEGVVYLDSPSETPQVLLTNTHFNYDSFLHENPHIRPHELKLIVHPNSGYDNFPKDLIKQLEGCLCILYVVLVFLHGLQKYDSAKN